MLMSGIKERESDSFGRPTSLITGSYWLFRDYNNYLWFTITLDGTAAQQVGVDSGIRGMEQGVGRDMDRSM